MVELTYIELKRVLDELLGYRHLLYFVDDGSRDGTLSRLNALAAEDSCVRVLALSRNFGHQAAITAGLDHVDRRADAVLVMDADLENPPSAIPAMLAQLDHGHDVVMGVRQTDRAVGFLRRHASRAFYRLFNRLSDVPIMPGAPDFFLLSARAREALARMHERQRFVRGMVAWIGFSRAYVPFVPPPRPFGRSKYDLGRMLRLGSDAIYAFSSAPIRLIVAAGLGLLGLGLSGLGYAGLQAWLQAVPVAGLWWWSGIITALSGVHLCALGLIGGYVARVFETSRERPLYLLKQLPEEPEHDGRLVGLSRNQHQGRPPPPRRLAR